MTGTQHGMDLLVPSSPRMAHHLAPACQETSCTQSSQFNVLAPMPCWTHFFQLRESRLPSQRPRSQSVLDHCQPCRSLTATTIYSGPLSRLHPGPTILTTKTIDHLGITTISLSYVMLNVTDSTSSCHPTSSHSPPRCCPLGTPERGLQANLQLKPPMPKLVAGVGVLGSGTGTPVALNDQSRLTLNA